MKSNDFLNTVRKKSRELGIGTPILCQLIIRSLEENKDIYKLIKQYRELLK